MLKIFSGKIFLNSANLVKDKSIDSFESHKVLGLSIGIIDLTATLVKQFLV